MIDLVPDRKYFYRQTNNEEDPNVACQCTSCTAGIDVVHKHDVSALTKLGKYSQPEDNLRHYTKTNPEVLAFFQRSHPGSKLPPAEWADVMVYAVNKIYGRKIVYYDGNITPQVLLADLAKGLPIMVSMKYPEHQVPGHYILVVGEDAGRFLVNDPYRNFLTGSWDGYHCWYSAVDWAAHSKCYGLRYTGL
jgi:hypothetical protein